MGYTAFCQTHIKELRVTVFHLNGEPIQVFRDSWKSACKAAGLEGRLSVTSAGKR